MAPLASPLSAEFFVAKGWLKLQSTQNSFEPGPIFDSGLGFDANLVRALALFYLPFVREQPGIAVFANAENVSPGPQRASGEIEQDVHFVGARGNLGKTKFPQFGRDCGQVRDVKLDFGLVGGGHRLEYKQFRIAGFK